MIQYLIHKFDFMNDTWKGPDKHVNPDEDVNPDKITFVALWRHQVPGQVWQMTNKNGHVVV